MRRHRWIPTLMCAVVLGSTAALAGEPNAESDKTFLEMLTLGLEFSPVITVIFGLFSFAGLFLVFHTLLMTREALTVPQTLLRQVIDDINCGDVDSAQQRCAGSDSLFAQTILPGLKLHEHPIERIQQAMEGAGRRAIASVRQEATYLANIGVIAPMLGLLGTVLGLMRAFDVMGAQEVREGSKPILMQAAIGEAMTTTAIGLMVGIPAMGLYYLCLSRVGRVSDEVEIAAEDVAAAIAEIKSSTGGNA